MTAVYPEKRQQTPAAPEIRELTRMEVAETSIGQDNPQLVYDLQVLRADFVQKMGWNVELRHDGANLLDEDPYDADPHTFHVGLRNPDTLDLKMGMRLTNVESVEDSLTWSMLRHNRLMQRLVENHVSMRDGSPSRRTYDEMKQAGKRGELEDLTRLVTPLDGSLTIEEIKDTMLKGFSFALEKTTPEMKGEPIWMFLTTRNLRKMLSYMGIQHEIVAKGKVSPEDPEDSYFCIVRPVEALKALLEDPKTPEEERARRELRIGVAMAKLAIDS